MRRRPSDGQHERASGSAAHQSRVTPKKEQASIGSPVLLHRDSPGVFRRTRLRITGLELRVRDVLIEPALHVFFRPAENSGTEACNCDEQHSASHHPSMPSASNVRGPLDAPARTLVRTHRNGA
jgi:hypothetical protein